VQISVILLAQRGKNLVNMLKQGDLKRFSILEYFGHRFVSKWVVLLIDLLTISLSLIIAYTILSNRQLNQFSLLEYYKGLVFILAFSIVGHYIFKPHQGVIRHTSMHDIKRVFYARTLSFLLNLAFIFFVSRPFQLDDFTIPIQTVFVHYVLSIYLLIQFRMGVKYIFNMGKKNTQKPKVIIYGSGVAGQLVHEALTATHQVVAYIDDNVSKRGKSFRGVPILYAGDAISNRIKKLNARQIIISLQNITPKEKRELVDKCIEWDLEVKSVPPIDKWLNGELTSLQISDVKIEDLLGRDVISIDKTNLKQAITGKVVLITGSAGSIGSEIARQVFNYQPKLLLLLDQGETPLYELEYNLTKLYPNSKTKVQYILCDVNDSVSMDSIFKANPIDWIFHAAAYKHVPAMETNPIQAIRVNTLGTKIIADLAEQYKVKKMIFVSTDKAVNPTNVMGASKRAAEMYVQSKSKKSSTQYITTRFGNVLGSNGSVIPLFKKQIAEGGPVTVTHKEITRYFMTIPEACQLVLEAGVMGNGGEIYVFDMGDSIKIADLAEKMIRLSGLIPHKDIAIEFTGLRPGEKLFEELLNDAEKIIPTHHEKIMIANVQERNHKEVVNLINEMQEMIFQQSSDLQLVSQLKRIVPEFISQNSIYSSLDPASLSQYDISDLFKN
jgi:FlaA1/EpsC-like NDP-sugar epimerase